jgi:hypothetical protein
MSPAFSNLYSSRLDRELGTDDQSLLFTTARRKSAINEGLTEFADLSECLTRWVAVAITDGVMEYNLNSTTTIPGGDFVRLAKEDLSYVYQDASSQVSVATGDAFVRRDVGWLNRYQPGWSLATVSTGVQQIPSIYFLRPDEEALWLGFTPVPGLGSSASANVLVPYLAASPILTSDTQEPYTFTLGSRHDLRIYHQAAVHYAAHQLEKLRRDDQASDRQLQKFLSYLARYAAATRVKGGRTINTVKSYFGRRGGRDE